jgi:hypothetical protein
VMAVEPLSSRLGIADRSPVPDGDSLLRTRSWRPAVVARKGVELRRVRPFLWLIGIVVRTDREFMRGWWAL